MSDPKADSGSVPALGDELSAEVAIKTSWSKSGFSIATQSRAVAAFDRLVGGIVGMPAAYVEGIRRRMELRSRVHEALLEVDGKAALARIMGGDDLGLVTAGRFEREQRRKQLNREAVWAATVDATAALPPPIEPRSAEPLDEPAPIDDDWMNIFERYAEDASSEKLRTLWGRILAGEIREPGAFSLSTMRVIAELDGEIAAAFEAVVKSAIGDVVVKPDPFRGEMFDRCKLLEEAGLVFGVTGNTTRQFGSLPSEDPPRACMFGLKYGLEFAFASHEAQVTVPVVLLSRTGAQIASILERDEVTALRAAVSRLRGATQISLIEVHARTPDDMVEYRVIEVLSANAQETP